MECVEEGEGTQLYLLEGPYTLPLWNYRPKNHNGDGLLGPDSIMVVYVDPLGLGFCT